jgi:hypothetical protein
MCPHPERETLVTWDDQKQQTLDDLRRLAQERMLTADEQQTLERLVHDLEHAEWTTLRPELSRLRQEQGQLQADLSQLEVQNATLAALGDRYADLLARARMQLASLLDEREVLRTAYERLLR